MSQILYNKSNQVLMEDTFNNDVRYRLYSYRTLVLEIVNGEETINAKTGLNYNGIRSVTTSKHITQAKSFLGI